MIRPLALAILIGMPGAPQESKPNVIVIHADDLGWGDLSCYGQKRFSTPRIDRMAAEGTRYTAYYAGSTVCAPSRCALMTGFHMGHAELRGNTEAPLRPEDVTVAKLLKQAGYATSLVGKWGLGLAGTSGSPPLQGFDESFGYLNQRHAHRQYVDHLFRNGEKVAVPEEAWANDLFEKEALDFVERKKDGPFFLYLAFTNPHAELWVPDDSLAEFKGKFEETPWDAVKGPGPKGTGPGYPSYRSQATPRAAFAAMITRMDRAVGRLLDKLKALGIDERTLVLFTSDNGPHREGGADPEFFDSNGPFRGIKRDLTEGGIRVPMIARWPGRVPAGRVSDFVWAHWDFLPTACALAGVKPPEGIDGLSIAEELQGRPQKGHASLYWEFFERGYDQAVRMGDWKGIRNGLGAPLQVYDLASDPGETKDLAAEKPDVAAKLDAVLKSSRSEHPKWVPAAKKEARVRALALSIVAVGCLGAAAQEPTAPRPNFVLMMTDDQRWDTLSLAGNAICRTPNMDRIGREGIVFRNAFVTNALCAPSRATFLTGTWSHVNGVVDNRNRRIDPKAPFLPDLLRAAGYEVGFFGKSHLNGALRDRTWDAYFGYQGQGNYLKPMVAEGTDQKDQPRQGWMDDVVTDKAVDWIKGRSTKPFCLFLFFKAPHRSWDRPPRLAGLYEGVEVPKPDTFDDPGKGKPSAFLDADNKVGGFKDVADYQKFMKDYFACVQGVDENIGKVFKALEETKKLDDTVMLHTGDNGFFLGEWGRFDKRFMHEVSIRVPLVIRYPKVVKAGSTSDLMAINPDWAPTVLELARVEVPNRMQGRSLVPILKGVEPPDWRKDWYYHYYEYPDAHKVRPHRGVRSETHKLIHYYEQPEEFELYDLAKDPQEKANLAADPAHAELKARLGARLAELRREVGD